MFVMWVSTTALVKVLLHKHFSLGLPITTESKYPNNHGYPIKNVVCKRARKYVSFLNLSTKTVQDVPLQINISRFFY